MFRRRWTAIALAFIGAPTFILVLFLTLTAVHFHDKRLAPSIFILAVVGVIVFAGWLAADRTPVPRTSEYPLEAHHSSASTEASEPFDSSEFTIDSSAPTAASSSHGSSVSSVSSVSGVSSASTLVNPDLKPPPRAHLRESFFSIHG
jgi:cytoskeletal protein RodZ